MDIKELERIIKESKYIVFFGGAGVSTESGLKDFRGDTGLYKEKYMNITPEVILSHSYFVKNTEDFFEYYKEVFLRPRVNPNAAHKVLAQLEKMGKLKSIITQNIDNLHQEAGSKKVIELHGSVYRNYAIDTKERYDGIDVILKSEGVPKTADGQIIRPDVILYEEPLNQKTIDDAINEIKKADCLIVAGTSLVVYPAAGLLRHFNGKYLIGINRNLIDVPYFIKGDIGKVLSQINLEALK
ncbi:NAD-dependent deacetylase [Alteracholeplasma palmae J233]|uniref:protein acetyllysine N-acetyltransferase n=1 Tax=Alteracholeplasma palmae (strain ATCC 49389 / J233) TaxID=1318466 RepID=U4KR96_ALTPJ|nr:NAD-dependent protein deacylase [Alteracholeplasma palmae]CCV63966.1 NAD-dependent deacetylase [Alteracholeplasma palmae J233]